jgi:hypothetical protein
MSNGCVTFQVGLSLLCDGNVVTIDVTGIPSCKICTIKHENTLIKFDQSHEVSSSRVIAATRSASETRT